MQGAQRTQKNIPGVRITADDVESVSALGHGALSQNFSGNEKARAVPGQKLAGRAHHENLAVNAGIHDASEPVGRAGTEQAGVLFAYVNDIDIQTIDVFPAAHLGRLAEKGGDEVQTFDAQPLIHDQPCGKDAVEAAGKESESMIVGHEQPWSILLLNVSAGVTLFPGRIAIEHGCRPGSCVPARSFHASIGV